MGNLVGRLQKYFWIMSSPGDMDFYGCKLTSYSSIYQLKVLLMQWVLGSKYITTFAELEYPTKNPYALVGRKKWPMTGGKAQVSVLVRGTNAFFGIAFSVCITYI